MPCRWPQVGAAWLTTARLDARNVEGSPSSDCASPAGHGITVKAIPREGQWGRGQGDGFFGAGQR